MYRAAAPAGGTAPARLGVSGAWRRAFGAASDSARDPALRAYVADMLRPYALDLAEDRLAEGQSYGEMAAALLADELAARDPVDLLVFAFAVPDVAPWRATASYLSHLCPGQPFAFAVCDQGVVAPFTALRLIRDYAGGGGCRRALLVVAEQAASPYQQAGARAPAPVATPARHAVVALRWDQEGLSVPGRRLARVCVQVSGTRSQACRLVADAVADLPGTPTTVVGTGLAGAGVAGAGLAGAGVAGAGVAGAGLAGAGLAGEELAGSLPGRVIVAPPEQPSTGVWWEFAAGLPGTVLLADYDPGLGHLGLAVIEFPGD